MNEDVVLLDILGICAYNKCLSVYQIFYKVKSNSFRNGIQKYT